MEKLKTINESLTLENNMLTEALKKRKCHYPKCDGQGNTNKKYNSHWSISYCPLFKKVKYLFLTEKNDLKNYFFN